MVTVPESLDKTVLRRALREQRRTIAADPVDRAARSARMWRAVVAAAGLDRPPSMPRCSIMMFESSPTEPDTSAWIAWCFERGHRVFVPLVDGDDVRVTPGDVDPTNLDVVVVPGVGFTQDGRRLGQGGGHYDRFLPRLRADCVVIGVCFAEQLVDDLPTEPHDRSVDVVVTDAVDA